MRDVTKEIPIKPSGTMALLNIVDESGAKLGAMGSVLTCGTSDPGKSGATGMSPDPDSRPQPMETSSQIRKGDGCAEDAQEFVPGNSAVKLADLVFDPKGTETSENSVAGDSEATSSGTGEGASNTTESGTDDDCCTTPEPDQANQETPMDLSLSLADNGDQNKYFAGLTNQALLSHLLNRKQNGECGTCWYRYIQLPVTYFSMIPESLNVNLRGKVEGDYLLYDCKEKERFGCEYQIRVKSNDCTLFCDYCGSHTHYADPEVPGSSKQPPGKKPLWYACYDAPAALKHPFCASLCVMTKGTHEDGYEIWECLYQKKFKCDYKVRIKQIGEYILCEQANAHKHRIEKDGPSNGLPGPFKDLVDIAYYGKWSFAQRSERLSIAATYYNLKWEKKLMRQIDNRLSYLRRTTNVRRAVQLAQQREEKDKQVGCQGS